MKSWFNFNGRDSRNMGVLLETEPSIMRPKWRVTEVTIPGRAGSLTIEESEEAYDPYIQSIAIAVKGSNVRELMNALRGEGWLTLSCEPNRRQKARPINAFTLKRVSPHLDWWKTTLAFSCEPFKYALTEVTQTIASGGLLINTGDVPEKPVIKLLGSGDLTVNDFTVTGVEGGCIIDCDAQEVTSLDGETLLTASSSGDFPTFAAGRTAVTLSDDTTAVFTRKERWL